jgi:hypothetical protein
MQEIKMEGHSLTGCDAPHGLAVSGGGSNVRVGPVSDRWWVGVGRWSLTDP